MRKGFTLIELLIVLAVIAALMAVATPVALNAVRSAKANQVAQNLRNIVASAENYFNVEKPANPTAAITLTNLNTQNYLKITNTTGYTLSVASGTQSGQFVITARYIGNDVPLAEVQKNLPGATGTNANIQYQTTVQKWW